ncbi:PhnB protein [Amphibacillus marinus]|uniref:PhnB protein n=1 Tax=Amphibacillus marinus TaxID=872970 RepID=A0A1H8RIV4_9BACI|nr:VOC family protein [Amphibacillus marinus]SEO65943.1 PhnB protein [Amphibacillus marinus]
MIKNLHIYLVMNGNGAEAIQFYQEILGAEVIEVSTFEKLTASMKIAEADKKRILHAELSVGGTNFMLCDTFPDQSYVVGNQVTIFIESTTMETTAALFNSLANEGQIIMPLEPTFWSPCYGQVRDKFGVTWQVSTHTN